MSDRGLLFPKKREKNMGSNHTKNSIRLEYFHAGLELTRFKNYAVPQLLFDSPMFDDISCDAKVLYSIMRDRCILSSKNEELFTDEEGRLYIIFKISDIQKHLNCGKTKAKTLLSELRTAGLLKTVKSNGTDRTNRIYVMNLRQTGENADDGYFYRGAGAEEILFYQMPKVLIENDVFKKLSLTAKVAYMFLYERLKLSMKNLEKYSDEKGRVFVVYTEEQMSDRLRMSRKTAAKAIKNLEEFGLIKKESFDSFTRAQKIYVMDLTKMAFKDQKEEKVVGNAEISQGPEFTHSMGRDLHICKDASSSATEKDENAEKTAENVEILQGSKFTHSMSQDLHIHGSDFTHSKGRNLPTSHTNYSHINNKSYLHQSYASDESSIDENLGTKDMNDNFLSQKQDHVTENFKASFIKNTELEILTTFDYESAEEAVRIKNSEKTEKEQDILVRLEIEKLKEKGAVLKEIAEGIVRYIAKAGEKVRISGIVWEKEELIEKLLSADSFDMETAYQRITRINKKITNYPAYVVSMMIDIIDTKALQIAQIRRQALDL